MMEYVDVKAVCWKEEQVDEKGRSYQFPTFAESRRSFTHGEKPVYDLVVLWHLRPLLAANTSTARPPFKPLPTRLSVH
jgi:hypothetical protein